MQYGLGLIEAGDYGFGLARIVFLLAVPLALCGGSRGRGRRMPRQSNALGTSRTIVVDPRDHIRIGTMDYAETLPLVDKEVVLTFDDGPIPPYTGKILDILAAECVKATYFIVGTMAREYPALVRRIYDDGHTVGTHSMSHPIASGRCRSSAATPRSTMASRRPRRRSAMPTRSRRSFAFRALAHPAAHEHAAEHGLMVWGADFPADDWTRIGPREVARRALQRLEAKGKGILLLHDIHQRTVDALPIILAELKARGFRVVHVVPASAERPATVTAAADWLPGSRPRPAARSS